MIRIALEHAHFHTCVIEHDYAWNSAHQISERAERKSLMIDTFAEFCMEPDEMVRWARGNEAKLMLLQPVFEVAQNNAII